MGQMPPAARPQVLGQGGDLGFAVHDDQRRGRQPGQLRSSAVPWWGGLAQAHDDVDSGQEDGVRPGRQHPCPEVESERAAEGVQVVMAG